MRKKGRVESCREALRVARAFGHAQGVANFTGNLADLALARKDWPTAETLAREALALAQKAVEIDTRLASPDLANAQAILTECEASV